MISQFADCVAKTTINIAVFVIICIGMISKGVRGLRVYVANAKVLLLNGNALRGLTRNHRQIYALLVVISALCATKSAS